LEHVDDLLGRHAAVGVLVDDHDRRQPTCAEAAHGFEREAPILGRLPDPLERNLYIERIALRLGLKESQVRDQFRGREPVEAQAEKPPSPAHRGPAQERVLLQLMLLNPAVISRVQEAMGKEGFSDLRHQKLARKLLELGGGREEIDIQEFLSGTEEEDLRDLVSELLLEEERLLDPDRMLEDCLRSVKLSRIRQEIQRVDEEIRERSRERKDEPWGIPGLKELLMRKQRLLLEQRRWMGETPGRLQAQEG
jgi:AraC-like DNA-binding protein